MNLINKQPLFVAPLKDSELLLEWREYELSLTEKLEHLIGNTQLILLEQGWRKACWWDKHFLSLQDALLFSREIFIKANGKEYWYARTVIPQKCYDLNPLFFKRLEHESIKNLIFGESAILRLWMKSYLVDAQCLEFHWVKKYLNLSSEQLWVRLAEFSFHQTESFYLIEILLPELENLK